LRVLGLESILGILSNILKFESFLNRR
jgi:hypothetical protein